MILDKENYEMVLFDLLEGNLSPQEEKEALALIEADPFMKREWELMQQTVLVPDTYEFKGKDALLKKGGPTRIIAFYPLMKVASAAAILIAIIGTMIWMQRSEKTDMVNSDPKPIENVIVPQASEGSGIVTDSVVDLNNDQNTSETTGIAVTPNSDVFEHVENVQIEPVITKNNPDTEINVATTEDVSLQKVELYSIPELRILDIKPAYAISDPQPTPEIEVPPSVEEPTRVAANNKNSTRKKDRNPDSIREWLNSGVAYLLGPYKDPQLSVTRTRDNQKPGLNIQFSSAEYQTTTLIQLKK